MKIKEGLCIGCGNCVLICPTNAIKMIENKAIINDNLCVECNVCYRNAKCLVKAIRPKRLKWPRLVRNPFSDVVSTHKLTGVPGRGTEEMKTNDITNRFGLGEIGISIEIGRPGVGTCLKNVDLFVKPLTKIGVEYEEASPITALLTEDRTKINEDIKNERVLSAIIEFKIPCGKIDSVIKIIREVEKRIDTVFTVGVISRVLNGKEIPIIDVLAKKGYQINPNAKVNIGLGKV
ncbi:MAG: 4Fe-4S ferredoxin [Promethearchaeota archaeon Loki_b31]|nr:MAG: 4Fe-4S ferredoxin [Candidatus Lokiarchaeota archaeon Loki_b31]